MPIVDTIAILFLGDVMQHKEQLSSASFFEQGDEIAYDYSSYFLYTKKLIEAADFTVANMEFSLGGKPYSGYPTFSAPDALAEETLRSGINLFLCANNHICDRGKSGLKRTIEVYKKMGAAFTGVYENREEEMVKNPYFAYIKGIKMAFINFTYGTNGINVPSPFVVNMMDKDQVLRAVKSAKDGGANIVIALPHWGVEYDTLPSMEQQRWNRLLLDSGVDVVVGGHPHVVQRTVMRKKTDGSLQVTIFSMGNYISNMSLKNTEMGAAFVLKIAKTMFGQAFVVGAESIPLWCSRAGGFEKKYTVLPYHDYKNKKDEFLNKENYSRMIATYERLKNLFKNEGNNN